MVVRPFPRALTSCLTLALVAGCSPAESSDYPGGTAVTEASLANVAETTSGDAGYVSAETGLPVEETVVVEPEIRAIDPGTELTFRIAESLSTESNVSGDRFQLTLLGDVISPTGAVLVSTGSAGQGIVAVAEESQGSDEPAVLQLQLVSLEVDGELRSVAATVVGADIKTETRDSGGEKAAKIGLGTAAGALVGGIIGRDRRGALIGAGAGAVAGTAVAVSTDEGHASIEEGSTVTVVMDERLEIR